MPEWSEGPERAEAPTEEMNEFRERVLEEHGLEGLEGLPEEEDGPGRSSEEPGRVSDDQARHRQEEAEHPEPAEIDGVSEVKAPASDQLEPGAKVDTDPAPKDAAEGSAVKVNEEVVTSEGAPLEAATVEAGSFSQNDNQIVVTEREGPEGPDKPLPSRAVETWDFHHFPASDQAEQSEEARVFEAVDYGKGANVRFPVSDLEEKGAELERGENAVVGLRLKDVQSEEDEIVFARFNAKDRRAEAYVGDIGGEKGSRYELLEAWRVDEDKLASEFEKGRCEHLENIRLEHADEKMFLNVDGRRVELEDYHISTSGAHAVIRGRLDGDDRCKVEFDGRRASVMLGRDYPVEGMRMEGDDLVVKWVQSRNEKHETRLYLEHLETPERPSLNQFDRKEMLDHVILFDHPERVSGIYQFAMDRESQSEIKRLLDDADKRGGKHYEAMKAEISETLVPNLLEVCGWKRIERHPFSTKDKDGASANGTDWLMETPDGKVVLMEVKWYQNSEDGIRKARTQAERDFLQHREDSHQKLEGAFIAVMDYEESPDGRPIKVHVLRVRPREELI